MSNRKQAVIAFVVAFVVSFLVVVFSADAQTINGELFNPYRSDHATAAKRANEAGRTAPGGGTPSPNFPTNPYARPILTALPTTYELAIDAPSSITTYRWADVRSDDRFAPFLVVFDEMASWPVFVRLVSQDTNVPEVQFTVGVHRGRPTSIDLANMLPPNTSFAIVVTIAESKNAVVVNMEHRADWHAPVKVKADERTVESIKR